MCFSCEKVELLKKDSFFLGKALIDSINIAYAVMQGANYAHNLNDTNRAEFIKNFHKYESNDAGKALVKAGPQL